jgi:hypothetical protein
MKMAACDISHVNVEYAIAVRGVKPRRPFELCGSVEIFENEIASTVAVYSASRHRALKPRPSCVM